jgi:hypothetical protein
LENVKLKKSEQVYWIKAAMAIITGLICMVANTYLGVHNTVTLMLGIAIYFAISEVMSIVKNINRNRTMRIGMGVFLFLWIFSWTLLNTLIKVL